MKRDNEVLRNYRAKIKDEITNLKSRLDYLEESVESDHCHLDAQLERISARVNRLDWLIAEYIVDKDLV